MPHFKYTVVGTDNSQLSGVVEAPNDETARHDLQELGFSVVSLEKKEKEEKAEEGIVFEFLGTDTHNKTISGTIKSGNRYNAFKRLISEYDLDVTYLIQSDLKEEEKENQKKEGIIPLMKKYQKEVVETKTKLFHEKKLKDIDRSFEKQKALVMRQVDFVLKKVNEVVDKFGKELNPQDKQTIINSVNKILRLKSSTNIDYIKISCKNLLKFLQNAEIFTHRKTQLEDKVKLYVDTQDMITNLDRGKDFGIYEDLEDQILRWKSEHIKGKKKIPFQDILKNLYYSIILQIIHDEKEARVIKKEINYINNELKQYYRIFIKAKDKNYRKEASRSIKKLRERKRNLKAKLHVIRENIKKQQKVEGKLTNYEKIFDLVNGVTGWLVFFYLIYYFSVSYIIDKELIFAQSQIPSVFYLFQTGMIKYILPVIFLLHVATSMKLNFFQRNAVANAIIFPVFVIISLLVVFNF